MQKIHYCFRTPDEVQWITALLAERYPDPDTARLGLHELMMNAIEHGLLGLTYEDKSRLLATGSFEQEIKQRYTDPENSGKHATIDYLKRGTLHVVVIRDFGVGFDWRPYAEFTESRRSDAHGRGIAIAGTIPGARLHYRGNGNTVVYSLHDGST